MAEQKPKKKRAPSNYNKCVSKKLAEKKGDGRPHREKFIESAHECKGTKGD